MRILGTVAAVTAMLGLGAAAAPQRASTSTFFGDNNSAVACAQHAKTAAATYMGMVAAIAPCTIALDTEALSRHQAASTYVNRGVILLHADMFDDAKADFTKAIGVDPKLGEAYVNRGAALVAEHQDAAGLADIDKGLALGAVEPERAYYNRGLALENMGDLKAAYESYKKAVELAPDWAPAKSELERFTVSTR